MILLEAMVLCTPIIAHAVGGITAVLDRGDCGMLVEEHRPSAYADAMYKLLINQGGLGKYLDKAYSRVTTFYSSKKNADAYVQEYKRLKQCS